MLFRIGMACESEIVQPPKQILARKPRYPTGKPRVVGRPRIGRCADLGILPTTEKQPATERRNEAPSWDTSVFVPNSSRIGVLVELENASGTTLLKQAVGSLRYCGIATRPDPGGHRITPNLPCRHLAETNLPPRIPNFDFTLTPARLRLRPRAPARPRAPERPPLARPSSRLAIYWNPTQPLSPPGCKGAIS